MRRLGCEEVARRLHTFLDRELEDVEIAEVQTHLDNCRECLSRFRFEASFRRLVRARSTEQPAPAGLREGLVERLGSGRGPGTDENGGGSEGPRVADKWLRGEDDERSIVTKE